MDGMAAKFESGQGSQGNALSTRAGATQAIPVQLREGEGAVKIFDAIYHNLYKNDAELLGAWKTVSHVERTGTSVRKAVASAPSSDVEAADKSVRVTNAVPSNGTSLIAPSPNAVPSNGASTTTNRTAPASD